MEFQFFILCLIVLGLVAVLHGFFSFLRLKCEESPKHLEQTRRPIPGPKPPKTNFKELDVPAYTRKKRKERTSTTPSSSPNYDPTPDIMTTAIIASSFDSSSSCGGSSSSSFSSSSSSFDSSSF